MNKGYQTRLAKGTQHRFTKEENQKGFKTTAERYPEKIPGIMRKWLKVPKYNGWNNWQGNPPNIRVRRSQ